MQLSQPDSLLQLLEIRPLGVDELSAARYVVSTAFARTARSHYSSTEADTFADFVRTPHYSDLLLGNRAYAAWIAGEMVGVAAWSVSEAKSATARILALFVHPMFGGHGIGSRLGDYLADEARAAGYRAIEAAVTLNASAFFERLGYMRLRQGAWALPSGRELPIAFMRKVSNGRADVMH